MELLANRGTALTQTTKGGRLHVVSIVHSFGVGTGDRPEPSERACE